MYRNILIFILGLILPMVACSSRLEPISSENETVSFELSLPEEALTMTRIQGAVKNFKVYCFDDDCNFLFSKDGRLEKESTVIDLKLEQGKAFKFLFLLADEKVNLPSLKEGQTYWDLKVWAPAQLPLTDPYSVLSSCGDRQGLMRIWSSANRIRVEMAPLASKVVIDNGVKGLEVKSLALRSVAVETFWGNMDPLTYGEEAKAATVNRGDYELPLTGKEAFHIFPDIIRPDVTTGEFQVVRDGKEEVIDLNLPAGMALKVAGNKVYYIEIREQADKTLTAFWSTKKVTKSLKILSQNLWGLSEDDAIHHFETSGADIMCAQECKNISDESVRARGYHILSHTNNSQGRCCIISKLPFDGQTPLKYGAYVDLGNGIKVLVMNCHGAFKPYGPYQLNGIEYSGFKPVDPEDPAQVAAVMEDNRKARQTMVDLLAQELATAETDLICLSGDFNEPSWLDWTAETKVAGLSSAVAEWPTTHALYQKGLDGDAYRTIHPDPVAAPGFTWSPKPGSRDTKDRIDLTLYKKNSVTVVKSCQIVGEDAENADIVITPWIFDHRGLLTHFEYTK